MGSPYGMQFTMDLSHTRVRYSEPQDTLSDVISKGPDLKTFEYLTKDSYYNEGLYNQGGSGYESKGRFTENLPPLIQESKPDFPCIPNIRFGNGITAERACCRNEKFPTEGPILETIVQERSLAEDLDLLEVFDVAGFSDSFCTEMKQCNLLDIIEADMEDVTFANDLGNDDVMWTLPRDNEIDTKDEQKAENCVKDLTPNEYFRNDKDTDKEAGKRKEKGKSSMVRRDALATLLRCQVCGGRASGCHYGAETCGACKIFFARYNQKSPPHTCVDRVTGRVLRYNSVTAGPCPGCRLQKCFQIGMDIKASKKGRYSYKRKYEYIKRTKDEKTLKIIPVAPGDVIDDVILMASHISDLFLSCKTYKPNFFQKIKDIELQYLEANYFNGTGDGTNAIKENCDVSSSVRIGPDIGKRQIYTNRFNSLDRRIKTYISFARKIPGFSDLPREDKISIFKGTAVFLAKISEYRAYNVDRGLEVLPEGHVVRKDNIAELFSEDYVDLLFYIAERFQKLNLNENERNLLKCVAFFSSEFCCTPEGKAKAEKHQDRMIKAFEHLTRKNRENYPRENCARVIGNAMVVLGDLHVFKCKADQNFNHINETYPAVMPSLVMEIVMDCNHGERYGANNSNMAMNKGF